MSKPAPTMVREPALRVWYGLIDPERRAVISGLDNFRDAAHLVHFIMEETKEGRTVIITKARLA